MSSVKTVNRRELNQQSGKIIDEVLATGEPVEVLTRGTGSVVISRKEGTQFDEWVRLGLVVPAPSRLDQAPVAHSARSVEEILDSIDSDH